MEIFAYYNPDDEIRRQSSSGGIFSVLAERILSEGGVVYGAAFDRAWNVIHRRVDNFAELKLLRGSKYVYSNVGSSYTDAANDLNNGLKVLFSGTPCQIAAMRKRVGEHPNLLLVEVVCHGAPEAKYWVRYLKEECQRHNHKIDNISSINFRDKRTGWKKYSISISFDDGKELSSFHGDNPYHSAFLHSLILRDVCFRCPFKYPTGSKTDITLGDFWKLGKIDPELDNDDGISLVIARTETGEEIINSLGSLRKFPFKEVAKYNPNLISSAHRPQNLEKFRKKVSKAPLLIDVFKAFTRPSLIVRIKIKLLAICAIIGITK